MERSVRHLRRNRTRLQIAADIIEIAKEGSRRTRIMYQGNLSFELLRRYLDFLTRSGLLKVQERGEDRIYVATEKGRRFLEEFRDLQRYSEMADTKRKTLERHLLSA